MNINARAVIDRIAGTGIAPEGYLGSDGLTYCLECGKPLEMWIRREELGINRKVPIMCDCQKKREAEAQERVRRRAIEDERLKCFHESRQGLSNKLYNATFETDKGFNPEAMEIAKAYVKTFDKMKQGLLLFGSVGSGKSFIAACIVNALIEKGYTARFTSITTIAGIMQESFDARAEVMREILKPSILVLDDLGAERQTEFMNEVTFSVIEQRYQYKMPMIVTTNITKEELWKPTDLTKARIYDRLLESCIPLAVMRPSIRREVMKAEYQDKLERMKEVENDGQ